MISSETEMTGEVAKALRKSLKMSQPNFWHAVGIKQSGGCRYELGQRIPRPVRILLFTIYVAELPIDATTPEGVAALKRIAQLQHEVPTVA